MTSVITDRRSATQRQRARVVVVTRPTELERLLAHHGTMGQVEFHLGGRGHRVEPYVLRHERQVEAVARAISGLAPDRRRAEVERSQLPHFLFDDDDIIAVIGQDGLVPNVAKYLSGQRVVGINPDPEQFDGILCRHRAESLAAIVSELEESVRIWEHVALEPRTMARVELSDGQELRALNEFFVGHRSHQSARYEVRVGETFERHSSSGVVCATGTGATGWALSIARQRGLDARLAPSDRDLVWFAREPFPSVATGTSFDHGWVTTREPLEIVSHMSDGGVIFADGIEADFLGFGEGEICRISPDAVPLNLVVPRRVNSEGRAEVASRASVASSEGRRRGRDRSRRRTIRGTQ